MPAITKAPHEHLVMLGFSPRAATALRAATPDWQTILRTGALSPRQVKVLRSGNLTLKRLIREAGFTRYQALSVLSMRSVSDPEPDEIEISDQNVVGGVFHEVLGSFVSAQDGTIDIPAPPFAADGTSTLTYIVAIGTLDDVWAKVLAGTSLGVEGTDWVQTTSTPPATTTTDTLTVAEGDPVTVIVKGPLTHPNQKINVRPIKDKIHDHQHPAPPPEGGGDGPLAPPTFAWTDDFERSDRFLNGDNGWANLDGKANGALGMPRFEIVSGAATVTSALAHPWGWAPITHDRVDAVPGVADVTFEYEIGPNVAAGGLRPTFVVAIANPSAGAGNSGSGIVMDMDPTTGTSTNFYLLLSDGSEALADVVGVNSPWVPIAAEVGAAMTVRMIYTDATKELKVYQDGELRYTVDYSDANFAGSIDPPSYPDTPWCPPLASMPKCGIGSDSNGNQDVFNLVGSA